MISQYSLIRSVSPEAEVAKKISSEHISKLLDMQNSTMEHSFKENSEKRWFLIAAIVIFCIVFIALVVILRSNPELMEKIITIFISAALGLGGGYGIGYTKGKHSDD